MKPFISIVIPIYQSAQYLRTSIDSIINQTFEDYEIILVDDGSTDESPGIIDEYAYNQKNIKVIHKENGGASSARNIGMDQASGEYILFFDSDDEFAPDALNQIRDQLDGGIDILFYSIIIRLIEQTHITSEKINHIPEFSIETNNIELFVNMLEQHSMLSYTPDKVYRLEWLRSIKARFMEGCGFGEDRIFIWSIITKAVKIKSYNRALYIYNIRDSHSTIKKISEKRFIDYLSMLKAMEEQCEKHHAIDSGIIRNYYCEYMIWAYDIINDRQYEGNFFDRLKYIKTIITADYHSKKYKRESFRQYSKHLSKKDYDRSTIIGLDLLLSRQSFFLVLLSYIKKIRIGATNAKIKRNYVSL